MPVEWKRQLTNYREQQLEHIKSATRHVVALCFRVVCILTFINILFKYRSIIQKLT